jgi:hypothetical protein
LRPGSAIYAQVDSVNFATNYGNVLERDEGNNIIGPVLATATTTQTTVLTAIQAEPLLERPEALPFREDNR